MTYENRNGLPLPIVAWLVHNDYSLRDENVISATTTLKSTKQIVLGRRYKESNKVVDVSDLVSSRMGTAIHASVEASLEEKTFIDNMTKLGYKNPEALCEKIVKEKRSEKELNGYVISGQFDICYNGFVMDIKSTSTWKYILDDGDDYIKQMSIYRWLNQDLITQDVGYICYIFTDWSQVKAIQDTRYPQSRIQMKEFPLLSIEDTEKMLTDKLNLVKYHEIKNTPDDMLPDCTSKERWEKQSEWKYYKNPAKKDRATKVFSNPSEAWARFHEDGGVGAVIEFKGESTACTYCPFINYCSQYTDLLAVGLIRK